MKNYKSRNKCKLKDNKKNNYKYILLTIAIRNVTAICLVNLADQAYFGHGSVSLLMQDSIIKTYKRK